MSYNSQTDYELAKARKFIASVDGLRGRFSVGIRTPKPSPNKPKFPYYVLVEKLPSGGTKTVHKAYNINELMAYFTANNPMVSAIWAKTNPSQSKPPVPAAPVVSKNTSDKSILSAYLSQYAK